MTKLSKITHQKLHKQGRHRSEKKKTHHQIIKKILKISKKRRTQCSSSLIEKKCILILNPLSKFCNSSYKMQAIFVTRFHYILSSHSNSFNHSGHCSGSHLLYNFCLRNYFGNLFSTYLCLGESVSNNVLRKASSPLYLVPIRQQTNYSCDGWPD